jgi:hypothetical protein
MVAAMIIMLDEVTDVGFESEKVIRFAVPLKCERPLDQSGGVSFRCSFLSAAEIDRLCVTH